MKTLKGQEELDEYKLTRREVADFLGITTNAVRMAQRGNNCHNLEYRFDGTRYLFKVPRRDLVQSKIPDHPLDPPKTSPGKPKKVYNRGVTHRGKGKYTSEAFRLHNEMKILNSINGRFKSEAHRKEFDKLNEEALKISQKNLQKKELEDAEQTLEPRPNQSRGAPIGVDLTPLRYGTMLNAIGIQRQDENAHRLKDYQWKYKTDVKFINEPGKKYVPYFGSSSSTKFGNFRGYEMNPVDDGAVYIEDRDIPPDDQEPEFKSKVHEAVWRLKNK
mgnify:CR=1 FL=1